MLALPRFATLIVLAHFALSLFLCPFASSQEGKPEPAKTEEAKTTPLEKEIEAHYRAMAEKIVKHSDGNILAPMIKSLKKQLGEAERQLSMVKKAKVGIDLAAKYKVQPKSAPLAYSSVEAKSAVISELSSAVKEIERAVEVFDDKKCVFIEDSYLANPVQEYEDYVVTKVVEPNEVIVRKKSGISKILLVLEPATIEELKMKLKNEPSGFALPLPLPLIVNPEGQQEREYAPGKKYSIAVLRNLDRGRLDKLLTRGGRRVVWDAPISSLRSKGFPYEKVLSLVEKK